VDDLSASGVYGRHFTSVSKKAERSLSNVDHKGISYVADDDGRKRDQATRQAMVARPGAQPNTDMRSNQPAASLFETSGGRVTSIRVADPRSVPAVWHRDR
jgi:hypothetical protein